MQARKLQDGDKLKPLIRSFSLRADPAAVSPLNIENRTLALSFSSELPVSRWFGDEVLSHDPSAADLSRLNDGGPLLFNHDMDDVIGVVETAGIGADRKGHASVRFAKTARGDEVMGLVADGILRNVSFMYRVDNYLAAIDATNADSTDIYTATRWCAYEISLVTVPADPTVGVGRSTVAAEERSVRVEGRAPAQSSGATATAQPSPGVNTMSEVITPAGAAAPVDLARASADATQAERSRIAAINELGRLNGMPDLTANLIAGGATIEAARGTFLDALMKRTSVQQPVADLGAGRGSLDLSEKEKARYSMLRAINAAANGDWDDAGFERECSLAIGKQLGREAKAPNRGAGFFMPMNLPFMPGTGKRDLAEMVATRAPYSVGSQGQGASLVATQLMASSFIEILRNRARVMQLGAQMLSGLTGNVEIPRQSGAGVAYWVTEGNAPTEAEAAFEKIGLTPRTVGTYSIIYRSMLLQATPDVEALARNDMAAILALAIDLAALSGTGAAGQPMGIVNTPGVSSVVGGSNGAAITIDNLIDLETVVTAGNAPEDTLAYLGNAKTIGSLKKLKSSTGSYLWTGSPMGMRTGTPGEINGYPVARSNQCRSTLVKGSSGPVCSEVFFSAWSELLIGEWGVMEMLVNPYGAAYTKGGVEVRALQTLDVAVRHPASFCVMSDALTP